MRLQGLVLGTADARRVAAQGLVPCSDGGTDRDASNNMSAAAHGLVFAMLQGAQILFKVASLMQPCHLWESQVDTTVLFSP